MFFVWTANNTYEQRTIFSSYQRVARQCNNTLIHGTYILNIPIIQTTKIQLNRHGQAMSIYSAKRMTDKSSSMKRKLKYTYKTAKILNYSTTWQVTKTIGIDHSKKIQPPMFQRRTKRLEILNWLCDDYVMSNIIQYIESLYTVIYTYQIPYKHS